MYDGKMCMLEVCMCLWWGSKPRMLFLRLVKFEIHVKIEMPVRYQSEKGNLTIAYMALVFKGALWTREINL